MAITDQKALEKSTLERREAPEQNMDSEVIIEITQVEPNLERSQAIAQIFPCR